MGPGAASPMMSFPILKWGVWNDKFMVCGFAVVLVCLPAHCRTHYKSVTSVRRGTVCIAILQKRELIQKEQINFPLTYHTLTSGIICPRQNQIMKQAGLIWLNVVKFVAE